MSQLRPGYVFLAHVPPTWFPFSKTATLALGSFFWARIRAQMPGVFRVSVKPAERWKLEKGTDLRGLLR
jgi:hypothetical protein